MLVICFLKTYMLSFVRILRRLNQNDDGYNMAHKAPIS